MPTLNRPGVFSPSLRAASAALLIAMLGIPASAKGPQPYTFTATGALATVGTLPGPPLLVEQAGSGTVTGSLGLTGVTLDLFADFTTGRAYGTLTYTNAAGDKLFGYTPLDQGVFPQPGSGINTFTFSGTETFYGGTGVFKAATGDGTYTGSGVLNGAGGNTFVYTSQGDITLPAAPVPEANTTTSMAGLLILGLLPRAFAAARRRRA